MESDIEIDRFVKSYNKEVDKPVINSEKQMKIKYSEFNKETSQQIQNISDKNIQLNSNNSVNKDVKLASYSEHQLQTKDKTTNENEFDHLVSNIVNDENLKLKNND